MIKLQYTHIDSAGWKLSVQSSDDGVDAIRLSFQGPLAFTEPPIQEVLDWVIAALKRAPISWIHTDPRAWSLDLTALRSDLGPEHRYPWLSGRVSVYPEPVVAHGVAMGVSTFRPQVRFYIRPGAQSAPTIAPVAAEIHHSMQRVREDHPDLAKTAFVMMRFGRTPAHERIAETIRAVLRESGLDAMRADDKQYHHQLWYNVQTYMHAASFGIAVLERLEKEDFNPNISLEIGYMLALGKPVILLKDQTLKTLQSDLVGHIYESFDTQDPEGSIAPRLRKWLRDNEIPPPH